MGGGLLKLTEMNISEGEVLNRFFKNRTIKRNQNCLAAVTGGTGCLSKDVILKGQTKSLGELYKSGKNFVDTFSITKPPYTSGGYYPIKSKSEIIDSGIKDVFEIEFEDGRKVIVTKDHKFFKREGVKFVEEIVSNLKVGNNLRAYPKNYSENHFNKAKIREQKKRDKLFNPKEICKKCNTLFYQEKKGKGFNKVLCKTCSIKNKVKAKKNWFEWEDNLLRQFYYDMPKKDLVELLPLRKTWLAIMHRANRLSLKRKDELQWIQNAFDSKNNPMKNKITKEKARQSINKYYETNSSWNKGIKQWEFKEHPKGMLGKHHTEETIKSIIKSTRGNKAHAWLGGISFEPYDFNFNKRFKEQIKVRDNFCCQICNEENSLHVHHIDYNKTNSNETNCITLCPSCHTKTNFNREYWEQVLSSFLINKYGYLKCTQQRLSQ